MSEETTISLRIEKNLHQQMKLHDEINWSAVLRRSIAQKINQLEEIDVDKARKAAKEIDKIRNSGVFSGGKKSEEIIREWRDKRR
ncbi:hypothetical protein COU57_06960 [Candidatus Pacearchaeota archaeon CG10_big_fil_rev_8_21_14_0_10_32_14]|nr:MAG: hypothetical protein COU57_06960 [Candidatus Pacearchaeota archaeon CG10_big_fil_rev_8_21_14_0_10_32_14]